MTILQKLLSYFYPVRMQLSAITGLGKNHIMNNTKTPPAISFYTLPVTGNNGKPVSLEQYRGKNILVVNLASNCGYTGQYADLETLYQAHKDKLVILGFPANDFGGQEPGSDEAIAEFCKLNFGVSFPLFAKNSVKGETMQPVYQWLTDPTKNGWNSEAPGWNFCKYLLNPQGELLGFFSPAVSPQSGEIINQLL
ncbi:glutathione peroxidase [soil metagenome]